MYKSLIVLFICAASIQAFARQGPEPQLDGPEPKLDGAADEAKKAYKKLLEIIGEAITEANNTCNTALDAMKKYALEIEADAKNEIKGLLESFQAQLDKINKKAKDAGIDISKCRKYEVQFSQLPDTTMDQIVACINKQITAAQNLINDAMNKAMTIQKDYYNIDKEIDDCGSGFKAIACLAKLVVKIGEDTIEGPSKIKDDIDKTVVIIKNAWPEVKKCATDAVEGVPSQAGNIVKDFALCAALPSNGVTLSDSEY